ncbi:MAG: carboxymuconolactone decarboxylase family protein [Anaerolineae bacterium]|nr:carboxymuconolactone decarboxylase family protein [Anaerolineae bacterium]
MSFNQIMMNRFETRGVGLIKYVQPVEIATASGKLAEAFDQMRRDFGMVVSLVLLHSPVPELLYGVWAVLRETLLVGNVPRNLKEAVSATVSKVNECPFCVDAHTVMLHALAEHEAVEAILQGRSDQIKSPEVRAMIEWASASRTPGSPLLQMPPFDPADAPEIIGVAVAFHYLNRMANIFMDGVVLPIPARLTGLKRAINQLSGSLLKEWMAPLSSPGESLSFLPDVSLPADLAWAASNPSVAGAYARLAAAVEAAGERSLPTVVRALVQQQVQNWQGVDPGLSRRWLEEAITELDETYKPAARLALLTALASYQVDEGIIRAFQTQYPGDDKLIGATAWASFTAARRAGDWLQVAETQAVSYA